MSSKRSRVLRACVCLAALLLALGSAGLLAAAGSPRVQALLGLAMAGLAGWGWRALARLQWQAAAPPAGPALLLQQQQQELQQRLLLLEGELEHVPVALFRCGAGQPRALNARARRLLAPGGAQEPAQLLQELAEARGESGRELLQIATERGLERWLLAGSAMTLQGEPVRLLALLPLESALEAETLRAWRQLVHVLTHEIMNSLTPIASLARSAQELQSDAERAQDLTLALDTVARRAEALARFVADYRRVSDWPEPRPEPVELQALFARLQQLVGESWRARGGQARFEVEPATLTLMADPGQLEQALINLIKNAAEATAELARPSLQLQARLTRGGRLTISVRDNGPGVPQGLEQQIFMPFFSARSQAGGGAAAGIGLAVVRNLVHGMGGTVRYVKQPAGGACFVLSF
ncbi:sensor histidine kinase [Paucibacter soli]|uniref:sensor histidine kinase n=1 Tax=Paucibacter soli TaxID=3133433 RepID=UPI00309AEE4F